MSSHQEKPITIVIACASHDFATEKKILTAQGFKSRQIELERISNDGYNSREIETHTRGNTRVVLANGSLRGDVIDLQPQFVVFTTPSEKVRKEIATYPVRPCVIEAKGGRSAAETMNSLLAHPAFSS